MRNILSRLGLDTREGLVRLHGWIGIVTCVLPLVVLGMAIHDVLSIEEPPPMVAAEGEKFGITDEDRRMYFGQISMHENHWREEARKQFPDHAWSQSDAYFNYIKMHIQHLSSVYKLHHSQLFMIFDEGIRMKWLDGEGKPMPATAEPLRPRTK